MATHDRMHFALFLATVIHATALLGVSFTQSDTSSRAPSLEITLAVHKSDEAPEEADFLAQANQVGSGTLEEKALLSTTEISEFFDNEIRQINPEEHSALQQEKYFEQAYIATKGQSTQHAPKAQTKQQELEAGKPQDTSLSLLQRSLEIASLEAQLREKRQSYAKRPRKRTLTALSTQAADDAAYLNSWRSKIENTGNANYGNFNISDLIGHLRMLVAINADGTIHEVRILKSSGHAKLDDAALKIVRLAAPFDAFPPKVRQETEILEIIRTWKFEKGSYLSGY